MPRIVKKFADRKSEIVNAARCIFKIKDYEEATIQDVMKALKIAKGTIYHYFKSKEELLEAVVDDIVIQNVEQMKLLVKETKEDALQTIKRLTKAGSMAEENKNILNYLEKPSNHAIHSRLLAVVIVKQAPIYAAVIQQGCEEGIFKTKTPLECAEFILSAVQFLTDTGVYPWTNADLLRRLQAFPTLIEQQLSAPAGSFHFLIEQMQPSV